MSAPRSLMRVWRLSAAAAFCVATGAASAASEPPANNPPADSASATPVPSRSPPVPLNSGASPHEFEADENKVTTEILPDGTWLDHLNGQGMQAVVAHIGADGKIEYTCSDHAAEHAAQSAAGTNTHEQ
jgi:hypothetical protein